MEMPAFDRPFVRVLPNLLDSVGQMLLTYWLGRFFSERCITPHGDKTFRIKMTRLAEEMGDSRLDVSRALNNMQQRGLIILHRGKIIIPDPHDRKNG